MRRRRTTWEGEAANGRPAGVPAADSRVALIDGVPVDDVTMSEAVDRIFELAALGRATGRTHQVATVNVDFVVNAHHDRELAALMRRTSLSVPDGMPVVWGARLLGTPLRERVAGADLVVAIVERAAAVGAVVALYGAAPGVADRAAAVLTERFPGVNLFASEGVSFTSVDELDVDQLDPLADSGADVCLVALGNPKQEWFIDRFGADLGIPVMIGVGGSFDFLVGVQRRAPRWMQRTGLEWVHRAATERRLIGRYVRDVLVFVPALLRQAWAGRRSRSSGAVTIRRDGTRTIIDIGDLARADNRDAAAIAGAVRSAWRAGEPIDIRGSRAGNASVPGVDGLLDAR